jgi:RNA polymerase sigma-70 factor (sigma-E family)
LTVSAFESFFRAEIEASVRLAALLGADDPEDVAQDCMVRLHQRWPKFSDDGQARAYLRRSVVNACRDRWRRTVVRRRLRVVDVPEPPVDDSVARRETTDRVLVGITRLSPRQREAIVLRYWHDLSEEAMAAAMGVSRGSVKTHLSRGMAALSTYLEGWT